jgi:hypothetical protein
MRESSVGDGGGAGGGAVSGSGGCKDERGVLISIIFSLGGF